MSGSRKPRSAPSNYSACTSVPVSTSIARCTTVDPNALTSSREAARVDPRYAREWLEQQAVAGLDRGRRPEPARRRAALPATRGARRHLAGSNSTPPTWPRSPRWSSASRRPSTTSRPPTATAPACPTSATARACARGRAPSTGRRSAPTSPGRGSRRSRTCTRPWPHPKPRSLTSGAAWVGRRSRSPGPIRKPVSSASTVMRPRSARRSSTLPKPECVNVQFVESDAAQLPRLGRFDAIFLLECLHDMARPERSPCGLPGRAERRRIGDRGGRERGFGVHRAGRSRSSE